MLGPKTRVGHLAPLDARAAAPAQAAQPRAVRHPARRHGGPAGAVRLGAVRPRRRRRAWRSAARWRWRSAQRSRRAWCCACIGRASCAPPELPEVFAVLDRLAARAGLAAPPEALLHPEPDAERVRGRRARRCGDRAHRRHAAHLEPARACRRAGARAQPHPQQRSVAHGAGRPGRPAHPPDDHGRPGPPDPGDTVVAGRRRPVSPGS